MGGLARAFGRLLVMAAVMAAVIVACLVTGVGTTIAVALGIVLAGLVGLIGVVRDARGSAERASSMAVAVAASTASGSIGRSAAASAPATDPLDPEALMPRWRRPSLLEARRADPGRPVAQSHGPMRFDGRAGPGTDRRVVRYAVVTLVDRPDEVLGVPLADLGAGDEVEVIGVVGAYLEVVAPSGAHGWIHRTTVSHEAPAHIAPAHVAPAVMAEVPVEAEDALTALLAARGLQ